MPVEKPDASYLWDMLDAAKAVAEFVRDRSFNDYMRNRMLRGAVERHVEIIGEAARSVSRVLRDAHPEILWDKIVRQRHVIAHEYGDIKHELLWRVATTHVPELIAQLRPLVPEPPPEAD